MGRCCPAEAKALDGPVLSRWGLEVRGRAPGSGKGPALPRPSQSSVPYLRLWGPQPGLAHRWPARWREGHPLAAPWLLLAPRGLPGSRPGACEHMQAHAGGRGPGMS